MNIDEYWKSNSRSRRKNSECPSTYLPFGSYKWVNLPIEYFSLPFKKIQKK